MCEIKSGEPHASTSRGRPRPTAGRDDVARQLLPIALALWALVWRFWPDSTAAFDPTRTLVTTLCLLLAMPLTLLLADSFLPGRPREPWRSVVLVVVACALFALPLVALVSVPKLCLVAWLALVAVYLLLLGVLGGSSHIHEWGVLVDLLALQAAMVLSAVSHAVRR